MDRSQNQSTSVDPQVSPVASGIRWDLSTADNAGRSGSDIRNGHQRKRSISRLRRASLAKPISSKLDMLEKQDQQAGVTEGAEKLGTFTGVFVPTTLNVLSILMFLRFGFILGQSGVLGMMAMLIASYLINLVTTMSISAIATNGTVRGGGAYYLISRSLGAEFGGSIGIVFYLGCVLNTGMNAVGLIDCLAQNFGTLSGSWAQFLPEGFWWQYLWATIVLILCTMICLAGSSAFARASTSLLAILMVATLSIPLSPLIRAPFKNEHLGIEFTGFKAQTFIDNLKPRLTKGAAGSQMRGRETFQDLFGILFPATGGIFAGASMSGDLKNPSRSIPKGTLNGLYLTFWTYTLVILALAASVTRESFYRDVNIIQHSSISGGLIVLGEFATTFFSALMGIIGAAKLLQAVARDTLLPGLSLFGKGTDKSDNPVNAILITFVIAQITTLFDINRIASFITMTYLMTFLVTNLACFLLKVGSAPNFRPSFHYFNSWTALVGTVISGVSMFFVDGLYASACVCVLVLLFLLIHYMAPPKMWGDVSQSLIYHQVRKYLLRLRPEHVKFWRPQILLFVDDFDTQYKMIHFCNSLKKGALFVLGHVVVTDDFAAAVPEVRKEQTDWNRFIEYSRVKAFINITAAPNAEWGIRNIVLNSGLGGMRPNIVVMDQFREQALETVPRLGRLLRRDSRFTRRLSNASEGGRASSLKPDTESTIKTSTMDVQSYLNVLEDLLFNLRINVAVARGFETLELPGTRGDKEGQKYIDLWPIQMSGEVSGEGGENSHNYLTTNFDTYTLILQLGCILHTVPSWKHSYQLRVAVFVEYETDVEEERGRVKTLLEKLRIEAEVLVFWLASGDLQSYRMIVNGEKSNITDDVTGKIENTLQQEAWWKELRQFRYGESKKKGKADHGARSQKSTPSGSGSSSPNGAKSRVGNGINGLKQIIESSRRKSMGSIVSLGMQTHRLLDSMVDYHSEGSDDEESSSDESVLDLYFSDDEGDDADPSQQDAQRGPSKSSERPGTQESAVLTDESDQARETAPDKRPSTEQASSLVTRPHLFKHGRVPSSNKFSSCPIPKTRVADEEGTGPSIMFADSSPPRRSTPTQPGGRESIYSRLRGPSQNVGQEEPDEHASGYPFQASFPLSFNDLPARAQHLILNELVKSQSEQTAVVFTTLPTPLEGTWNDRPSSESYVDDLEVLCDGLPPCLLVHSNSVTVTMNL
ncbi:hypothetical protein FQN57_000975 [Myotisia sp. PD_48]|nr:hypothetical protein FQN57_000975 [Myotisia sp. PD_48]